jgi:hypothetical protein
MYEISTINTIPHFYDLSVVSTICGLTEVCEDIWPFTR